AEELEPPPPTFPESRITRQCISPRVLRRSQSPVTIEFWLQVSSALSAAIERHRSGAPGGISAECPISKVVSSWHWIRNPAGASLGIPASAPEPLESGQKAFARRPVSRVAIAKKYPIEFFIKSPEGR